MSIRVAKLAHIFYIVLPVLYIYVSSCLFGLTGPVLKTHKYLFMLIIILVLFLIFVNNIHQLFSKRIFSSIELNSFGKSDEKLKRSFVTGCVKPTVFACNNCPSVLNLLFLPYTGSPTIG